MASGQVNLALSVHSPFEEERVGLMPITRQYPLAASVAALADGQGPPGRWESTTLHSPLSLLYTLL